MDTSHGGGMDTSLGGVVGRIEAQVVESAGDIVFFAMNQVVP